MAVAGVETCQALYLMPWLQGPGSGWYWRNLDSSCGRGGQTQSSRLIAQKHIHWYFLKVSLSWASPGQDCFPNRL